MIEIRLAFKSGQYGEAELLQCILAKFGISPDKIVEQAQGSRKYLSFFVKSPKRAQLLREEICLLGLKGTSIALVLLKDSDWKTAWKKYFKPFNITRNIRVVPIWRKESKKKCGQAIYIDTTFAFGTGLHATTQMMAQLIAGQKGRFRSFLDIGTGSGILSLIANRCGAEVICALDVDKETIKTAKQNFRINHCRIQYLKAIDARRFRRKEPFDLVVANLFTQELIRLRMQLISCVRPGKYLAVSGISQENFASFRKQFATRALHCLRILKKRGWYAVLFKKTGKLHK